MESVVRLSADLLYLNIIGNDNGEIAVICLLTEEGIAGINAKAEFIYGKQNLMGLLKQQSLIVPPM